MEEERDLNSLIVVEQLPIIKEQLQIISDEVDKEIEFALSLECTEDSKTEVKKARARLNKINQTLEDKRKAVKKAIEEPYRAFEEVYDKLIKEKLKLADGQLKAKIDDIENNQKQEKIKEVQEFFDRQVEARGLEDILLKDVGLNITLSSSLKSLKEQVVEFLDKIEREIELINSEEYKTEILAEYEECLDFAKAKMIVLERHERLNRLAKSLEKQQELEEQEQKIEEKVEAVIEPPKEIIEDDEVITVQFTIKDTKANILKVREFMKKEGIKYE